MQNSNPFFASRHIVTVTVVACLCLVARAAEPEKPAPGAGKAGESKVGVVEEPGATAHEGVWKPIAAVLGGVLMPPPALKAITLKITGANYEVTVDGEKESDRGTCILDTSTTPHRMTIKSTAGPNSGKTFLAIYEMKDAGKLRVCYDLSGAEFPKEFKAPKGTQLYLVGYRRPQE
jgi:uncharacterized protein (TIGR03067 family)